MSSIFLKFDPIIKGDATDEKHKEWIEVHGFTHHVSQPTGGPHTSAGHLAGGRSIHGDFQITKKLDSASPLLFLHCCNGKPIKEARIEMTRAMGSKTVFMVYTFKDLIIASVTPTGQQVSGADEIPMETITVRYSEVTLTYTPTDVQGAKKGPEVKAGWNVREDRAV